MAPPTAPNTSQLRAANCGLWIFVPCEKGEARHIQRQIERHYPTKKLTAVYSPTRSHSRRAQREITGEPEEDEREGREVLDKLKKIHGGAYSLSDLTPRLGISAKSVLHDRRKRHRIAFWKDAKGHFHYPKWQFDEDWGVRPIVKKILQVLRSDDAGHVLKFFLLPADGLGGSTVVDLMVDLRQEQRILTHARKASVWENR